MKTQFTAILTDRDLHTHIPHEFTVEPGTTQIAIEFRYEPQQVGAYKNLLTLTVFDPSGCRGAWHRLVPVQSIAIGVTESTPGFLAGAIEPGVWNIVIDVHMALPDQPITYTIDISTTDTPIVIANNPAVEPAQSAEITAHGAGWYRGNLHSHTLHSDGSWNIPDLVNWARAEQLDFITLTDHNTVSGLQRILQLSTPELLTMGGIELTTFYGHALALGIHNWLDWRIRDHYSIADIQRAVENHNGQFIIAHPKAPGGAICTGCAWEYADMMPGNAHSVEVWNSDWDGDSNNEFAVQLWYGWLNQGYRLVATAGTDIHRAPTMPPHYGYSVVYADDLTEAAILQGIVEGHVYLSDGKVQLSFTAEDEGYPAVIMGDTVHVSDDALPQLSAQVDGGETGDRLRLIVNGTVHAEVDLHSAHKSTAPYSWSAEPSWQWALIEVRALNGVLRALSNPIYLEWANPSE